jgi:hypothetical protein
MVGDYMATSVFSGVAWPAMIIAAAPVSGTFNEALYEATGGLTITGGALSSAATPVVTSGHRPAVNGKNHLN